MKKVLLAVMLLLTVSLTNAQLNVTFRSNLPYPNAELANIGGYVDSLGNEYALVGYQFGLSIVNVTDPDNPVIAYDVPGFQSEWREVKTWQHYAYVTTEAGGGLQIIDLGGLPGPVIVKQWTGDGAIAGNLETIHSLHIDNGYAYLNGSNLGGGAALIVNLIDPWNPTFEGITPGSYIHDCYVRNDTLWGCHIYDGYFSAMDVHDKTNPQLLSTQVTPNQFTHNAWLNDAGSVLFTTDEVNDSYLASYDVTDVNNIRELDRIQLTPGSGSIIHNTHTLNDYEVVSWYKDGIAIVDVARPDNMIIVGHYDTYPQGSGGGFNGCWGVYPYLPSGNLVCSDINNGLYVLTPTYIRGCYLEGNVTDSVTGVAIYGATIEILGPSVIKQSKLNGDYKTGLATAGLYDVKYTKAGYFPKTITGLNLQNGILTMQDVALAPLASITVSGHVNDASSGLPVGNAIVSFHNSQFDNVVNTNSSGDFTINGFFPDTYDFVIGKWGYNTYCGSTVVVDASNHTFNISLDKGYYDDFTLDFGWTYSGSSANAWERAIPVGTLDNANYANPNVDLAGDCSDYCYVTDNGGGGPWDHDVDGTTCILTSPVFDATLYINPVVSYSRWFYNGGFLNGPPNDTMKITLSNGITSVELERMNPSTAGNGTWVAKSFPISNFITPTANMQLKITTGDPTNNISNIVEGGLDKFSITETVGVEENNFSQVKFNAMPNPFDNIVKISYDLGNAEEKGIVIEVCDVTGRIIAVHSLQSNKGTIDFGNNWPAGIYMAQIKSGKSLIKTIRLNKTR